MYHPDHRGFIETSAQYGPIGQAVVELSRLELANDDFIFAVNKEYPDLAIRLSKSFPRQFKDKVDFTIGALVCLPSLRAMPIRRDGWLDLVWLQYQLDELYQVRATLAHGAIHLTRKFEGGTNWRFTRKVSPSKGNWVESDTSIGSGFLANVVQTANDLRRYFHNLEGVVKKEKSWEQIYQKDKEIRKNREFVKDLLKAGAIAKDSPHYSFLEAMTNDS